MFIRKSIKFMLLIIVAASLLLVGGDPVSAQKPPLPPKKKLVTITQADREAAAKRAAAKGLKPGVSGKTTASKTTPGKAPTGVSVMDPGGAPHYFGPFANYANSPLPKGSISGLTLDNGGSGYTAPVVTISDVYGTGSGATATATVAGGVITGLTLTNPGNNYSAPIVFIDDPNGVDAAASATIAGLSQITGNPLTAASYSTDNAANVFVVNTHAPLSNGSLTSFMTFNQPGSGPNTFNAYVLRPTGVANEYTVILDSGPLSVPSVAAGQLQEFPVGPVAVQAGDLIAHYGQGIPLSMGGVGADTTFYPAGPAPVLNQTITFGTTYPVFSTDRTYSLAAKGFFGTGGIRKFVDSLPGAGAGNANNLGQYIPIGTPDIVTYPGADHYVIELKEYTEKMHSDLPATKMRGYRQTNNGTNVYSATNTTGCVVAAPIPSGSHLCTTADNTVAPPANVHYLGPTIVAQRDRAVRITFRNNLPINAGGNLFIPVDPTVMGSGMTPALGGIMEPDPQNPMCGMNPKPADCFKENRATLHLHGGLVPWISDGTPHQWTTPALENTSYPKGVSVYNVPDMPNPGTSAAQGELTFYYNNEQSARLMFYHDHSWGITRLNVYAGEAAGYILTDQVEQDMINGTNVSGVNPGLVKVLPDIGIPLVIQDRSYVDPTTIAAQDPTWPFTPQAGALWYPHVYMPNQNPADLSGMNAFGRWHYGPWFWPPTRNISYGPIANPYYDCGVGQPCTRPWEPPQSPGTPNLSMAVEGFMDTPIVNGTAYPYLVVEPKAYRFRVLNAANDRFFNLQWYVADPTVTTADGRTNTEVKLVPAPAGVAGYPAGYMVPDATMAGPSFIQIGTEGGFLPKPAVLTNKPIGWNGDPTNFDMGLVNQGTLILGAAERADVIVDFRDFADKTLILYNDSPAPFPALDARYDYYTGKGDHTDTGGSPDTQPGFGPNTRTIMQIRVKGPLSVPPVSPAPAYDLAALNAVFADGADPKRGVFEVSQDPIIIPNTKYNTAYNKTFASEAATKVGIADKSKTFQTISGATLTIPFQEKSMHDEASEVFDEYGRMSGMLGLVIPTVYGFAPYPYTSPPVDMVKFSMTPMSEPSPGDGTQIWKITHNGVDTHPIHFHLFNVQLINRVAWDNATRLPDLNELGWKETVRMNPLQDTIVALRPIAPTQPFKIPNAEHTIDASSPQDATLPGPLPDGFVNPQGTPVTVLNNIINFGWEYVYHCHILGHEEMDMMHSVLAVIPPDAPLNLNAAENGNSVVLSWADNSVDETRFTIQKKQAITTTWTTIGTLLSTTRPGVGSTKSYTDPNVVLNTAYDYRVLATNNVGTTEVSGFTLPLATGFPTMSADSNPSNTATITVSPPVAAPTNLLATVLTGLRVRLTWRDNATNETSFVVERSANGGAFTQIATPGPLTGTGTVNYTDATVAAGASYAYRVKAVNGAISSAYSNTANANVPAIPAAPSNFTVSAVVNGNNAAVTLTWTDNSNNETGFRIQRATNATFTAGLATVTLGPNTTTRVENRNRNRTYYYRIQSFNGSGSSAWVNATPFPITTP